MVETKSSIVSENSDSESVPVTEAPQSTARWALKIVAVAFAVFLCLLGTAWAKFGSAEFVERFLRGEKVVAVPQQINVGTVGLNEELERTVEITNLTLGPIELVGAKRSCGCITLDEFPVTIPSGGTYQLSVKMRAPSRAEEFGRHIKVFDECG